MTMTDPIADILTRIRNACMVSYDKTLVPSSKVKIEILKILKDEGYIKDFCIIKDKWQDSIEISLKYNHDKSPVIKGLKRLSKPSCRVYSKSKDMPRVLNGYGINIISTSQGLVVDREARKKSLGGEILCSVW